MTIAEEAAGARRPFEEAFSECRQDIIDILKKDGTATFVFLPSPGKPIELNRHTDGKKWFVVDEVWEWELDSKLQEEGLKTAPCSWYVRQALKAYL